ncbi:hypothetical protein ACP275_07G066800 [Erythranthe tilingii]
MIFPVSLQGHAQAKIPLEKAHKDFASGLKAKKRHTVKIYNRMPQGTPALTVHCASKDDDLGYRTLYTGQDFNWSFRTNFWGTTLFFCRFWWGRKTIAFDVFNADWEKRGYHHTYTYEVNKDGAFVGYGETPSNPMLIMQKWP